MMSKQIIVNDIMDCPGIMNKMPLQQKKRQQHYHWIFCFGLYLFDFLATYASFGFALWVAGVPFSDSGQWMGGVWTLLFVFLSLSFFPSSNLYSYHLIFSRKQHFLKLLTALVWGSVALAMLVAQYALPYLWEYAPVVALTIGAVASLGMMWFVRCFKDSMHNFLRAAGISLIANGLIVLGHDDQATLFINKLWFLSIGLPVAATVLLAGRYVMIEKVYHGLLMRRFRRQVGIIGTDDAAQNIVSHIIRNNAPFWVTGSIGCRQSLDAQVPKHCLGDIIDIPTICDEYQFNDLIVTDGTIDRRTLISLLDFALDRGITVWFQPEVLPVIDRKIHIDHFCGVPMIRISPKFRFLSYSRIKYILDVLMTLPLIVAISPFLALVAAAIKIDSPGPVFYKADAIGKDGNAFKMFKFRSMRVNNDNNIHKQFVTKLIKGEIGNDDTDDKPLKIVDDPRITLVGKLIRKYSIDELPQLFNVLLGQMSLIGPRPCLPYEYDVYQDWYKKRAAIRPGITGLWQVAGRSEVEFEEMILLDLFYVYNRNLLMDCHILIKTIDVVVRKKGAY